LASLKSIRKFAKKFLAQDLPLHVLILNAGIMACPLSYTKGTIIATFAPLFVYTHVLMIKHCFKDGFEMQFGVNHLGHFLLANLLLDKIKRSSPARVVVLSSSGHTLGSICWDDINAKKSYSEWRRYGQSKLANILFARELQRQLDEEGAAVHVNCVHPGGVNTDLARHSGRFISVMAAVFFKTVEQGAATTIYAAIHPNTAQAKGVYFADCAESTTSKEACNMDDAKRLWQVSSEMVNLQSALKKCYKKQVKNESNV
jgi:NAD(P)-dependent dehydrogenase (short-subunit alcohol dehydrogenase family)